MKFFPNHENAGQQDGAVSTDSPTSVFPGATSPGPQTAVVTTPAVPTITPSMPAVQNTNTAATIPSMPPSQPVVKVSHSTTLMCNHVKCTHSCSAVEAWEQFLRAAVVVMSCFFLKKKKKSSALYTKFLVTLPHHCLFVSSCVCVVYFDS